MPPQLGCRDTTTFLGVTAGQAVRRDQVVPVWTPTSVEVKVQSIRHSGSPKNVSDAG